MEKIKKIQDMIQSWFNLHKWSCSWDEKNNQFSFSISCQRNCIDIVNYIVSVKEDYYIVHAEAGINVDKEFINDILKQLNSINRKMIFGSFFYSTKTRDVEFKMPVDCKDRELSKEIIEESIFIPAQMYMKFGEEITSIANGNKRYVELDEGR